MMLESRFKLPCVENQFDLKDFVSIWSASPFNELIGFDELVEGNAVGGIGVEGRG
jgi:hypothetical protein